jgi:hypothetical protein
MPYRKRYSRRRRYRRRGRSRHCAPKKSGWFSWGGTMKLIRDVAYLKSLVNTEFKQVNTSRSFAQDNSGTVTLLNALIQGDDYDNRGGRMVRFKSLEMRYIMTQHASATNTQVRNILFIDKTPSGSTPQILDLITAVSLTAPRNLDNRKRFVILCGS